MEDAQESLFEDFGDIKFEHLFPEFLTIFHFMSINAPGGFKDKNYIRLKRHDTRQIVA